MSRPAWRNALPAPRYIEFVDEFPMTVTGKIQKFMMRQAVESRLGLKAAKTA